MVCPKCNNPLIADSMFCNKCGTKIETVDMSQDVAKSKKAGNKKKFVMVSVAAVLLIGGAIGIFAANSNNNYDDNSSTETATEEIEPIHEAVEEVSTHEHGLRVAEEFLSGFTTLFLEWGDSLIYMGNLLGVDTSDSTSLLNTIGERYVWYNNNPFPDALQGVPSFSKGVGIHPGSFSLFDANDDGIPLIAINYTTMFANGYRPYNMFKYVDGEYVEIGMFDVWPLLFRDSYGRLILREGGGPPFHSTYTVSHITLSETGIDRQIIEQWDWYEADDLYNRETELGPGIPLEGLTPLRMEGQEAQIRANATPIALAQFETAAQNAQVLLAQRAEYAAAQGIFGTEIDLRRQMIEALREPEGDLNVGIYAYINADFALLIFNDGSSSLETHVLPFIYNTTQGSFTVGDSFFRRCPLNTPWVVVHPQYNAFSVNSSRFEIFAAPYNISRFETFVLQDNQFIHQNIPSLDVGISPARLGTSVAEATNRLNSMTPLQYNAPRQDVAEARNRSGLIFTHSDRWLLDEWSLEMTSIENLRIARNEIFARHGRLFYAQDLQTHFNRMPWYNGHIDPANWDESVLNAIERQNVALIQAEEARRQ